MKIQKKLIQENVFENVVCETVKFAYFQLTPWSCDNMTTIL